MERTSQYLWRRHYFCVLTPYATIISRHHSRSNVSYEFLRSRKTLYMTSSLISVSLCSSFTLKETIPIPHPSLKPQRTSWNLNALSVMRLISPGMVFQRTSTRPIPLYSPLPFGMRTTVYHVHLVGRVPYLKSVWTKSTTRSQLSVAGTFSYVAVEIHPWRCSTHIYDVPPEL